MTPTIDYEKLAKALESAKGDPELFKAIVNSPFFKQKKEMALLFLGIAVLLLVNKKTGNVDRVALSDTELAKNTTKVSVVPFKEIKIPLDTTGNIITNAIHSGEVQDTTDWRFLFHPALTPEQARINQASAGISYSTVYPLKVRDGGAMIFSYFHYEKGIGEPQRNFMEEYVKLVEKSLAA